MSAFQGVVHGLVGDIEESDIVDQDLDGTLRSARRLHLVSTGFRGLRARQLILARCSRAVLRAGAAGGGQPARAASQYRSNMQLDNEDIDAIRETELS